MWHLILRRPQTPLLTPKCLSPYLSEEPLVDEHKTAIPRGGLVLVEAPQTNQTIRPLRSRDGRLGLGHGGGGASLGPVR